MPSKLLWVLAGFSTYSIASSSTVLELHFGICREVYIICCGVRQVSMQCRAMLLSVMQPDRQSATCQELHDHIGVTNIEDFTPQVFYFIKSQGLNPWKDTQKIRCWVWWWQSLGCQQQWVLNDILWPDQFCWIQGVSEVSRKNKKGGCYHPRW